ncbi:MAG: hypothetical protein KAX05_15150 [Bacteroidales bacterium]|nr:hypothetical protein [Bacteroidales bacterium]
MEKERLKYTITRFDHYYDSVNNKGNVILGLSTFIVGGLIASYPFFLQKVNCTFWVHANLITLITLGLAAMLIMIIASTPYLSSKSNSVFYFLSVSKMKKDDFAKWSEGLQENYELEDMRNQTYLLAKGLTNKFRMLKWASMLINIQFVLLVPFIILLINSLSN